MWQESSDLDVEDFQEEPVREESFYTLEQELAIKVFAQDFYSDVKVLAKQYMEQFFKDKMLHCGGKIPKSLLFADRRLSMVLNYDIIKGVERAYKYLEPMLLSEDLNSARQTGETTEDIKLVNGTLCLLAQSGIPQQFAGGMLCLYLEFIEGINIGSEP
jgi:hypothetical protein